MNNNETKLDLGFAVLTVEVDTKSDYPAAYIGLCDKNGVWLQDIACVRMGMAFKTEATKAMFETLIFGNKDDEDYTHKIECGIHRDYYMVRNEEADYNLLVLSPSDEHAVTLAEEYAKDAGLTGVWVTDYLTSENNTPIGHYDCDYVIQDKIFEEEEGVLRIEDLGVAQKER